MDRKKVSSLKKCPQTPAVYFFKDKNGEILYIGKAGNLKSRLVSYFKAVLGYRHQKLIDQTKDVFYIRVDSPFKALLLEAQLIKKYQPKFNVKLRDDKAYPFIEITTEKYPRVSMQRKIKTKNLYLGPFVNKKTAQAVLQIARSIFPFRSCRVLPKKPCLYYHLKLCRAPCINKLPDYKKTINHLIDFLTGKNKKLLKDLARAMIEASKNLDFAKAATYKVQIEKIQEVNRTALTQLEEPLPFLLEGVEQLERIECFDISVFAKKEAVGSMVVFSHAKPSKKDYRRFKIRGHTDDDLTMMKEVMSRRLKHKEWPLPQLFIVDGGRGQVKVAYQLIRKIPIQGLTLARVRSSRGIIPLLGLVKGKEEIIKPHHEEAGKLVFKRFKLPKNSPFLKLVQKLRDESHRFAINYHRLLRSKKLLAK